EYLENSSNAIAPEKPYNSLSMGDEHISTISETKSDEVIKSSVENLVPIPSESEVIFDDTCDVLFCDISPHLDVLNGHFEIFSDFNDDCTSSDDDSFKDIDFVEASPPDSELISLEEVKDDILREKLLNINLLIAKIESLNDNPTPDCVLKYPSPFPIPVEDSDSFFEKSDTSLFYSNNSLPEFKTFSDHTKEINSSSTTTHADNSLPEYDSFLFEIEPDQGELTSVVIEYILGEPHVHVSNVLLTHPTLILDSDFIPSNDSFRFDLKVSFPSRTRNKIFDLGIFFEVQSKRFLSRATFSISFIRNLLCPMIETLLSFSSENEEKVFNPGFPAQSIRSSNMIALDSPYLLVLINGTSQSRQHGPWKQTAYTIQSVRHQPGPGHPNTDYDLDSDESDDDEPYKVLDVQRLIHHLSDSPTPFFDPIVESLSLLFTPFMDSDSLLEEKDTFPSRFDDSLPDYETFCFDIKEKSNVSTTSHSDHSHLEYEAFCFDIDHMAEKSSGSTTSHYDFLFLNMNRFTLIFRLISFLLPIGVICIMRE
nr:hypothetical protein [Tanacetum cinerariifolium]